jgi:hypothetical protein
VFFTIDFFLLNSIFGLKIVKYLIEEMIEELLEVRKILKYDLKKHCLFYLKIPDENKKIVLNIPNVGYVEHLHNIKQAEKLELQAVSL